MKKRPNILLLFPDQHRGDWMPYCDKTLEKTGMDPSPVRMPNIKRLMENGVTFTNTVSSSPVCAPARACLASGRRYENCGVKNNWFDYNLEIPTFYTALKNAGYYVGGVGKFDLHKKTQKWGISGWCNFLEAAGFTHGIDNAGKFDAAVSGAITPQDPYMAVLHEKGYAEYYAENIMTRKESIEPTKLPDELYCDNWIGDNACKMIKGFKKDKPWFIQVNFAGPHNPWDVTEKMRDRWKDVNFPKPHNAIETEEYNINGIRQNYAAMLENIDGICGKILKTIEKRGEMDNTIVIYTSDHGEMLGDYNLFGKSKPHKASIHIPLVISGTNIASGKTEDSLVELQDLTSTILDFCGVTSSFTPESISLCPTILQNEKFPRRYQVSALDENGYWKVVQNHEWKIVIREKEISEIYDLTEDFWQSRNLLENENFKAKRIICQAVLSM